MARKRHDRAAPSSLDENTLNILELAVFVEDSAGFRLGLATYDVPETRDTYLQRLAEAVAARPVHLTQLDLTRSSGEESLLKRLREHLQTHPAPNGKQPAVMVVGLEAAIDFRRTPDGHQARGGPLLHNANLQRDAFARLCPAPVVLWLSPFATTAFAQAAPDLWHWRSGSFTFTGSPEARRRLERELIATPLLEMGRLATERKRERLGLLRDLLAELEMAEDRETPGNQNRRAAILQEIGLTCGSISEIEAARGSFDEAVRLYREIGDRRGEGNALGNLGLAYADLGQVERAIDYYEQALVIAREIGDRRGEGNALGNLGLAYADLGQVERAIDSYEKHLAIAREIGDRRGEGNALGNLGSAYARLGQVERAIDYYEQALVIAREIGDRRGEGNALGNLGLAYADLGQMERAIGILEQALRIGQEIKDPRIIQITSDSLARLRGEGLAENPENG